VVVDEKEIVVQEEIKENRVKVVQKEEKVQKEKVVEDVTEEDKGVVLLVLTIKTWVNILH